MPAGAYDRSPDRPDRRAGRAGRGQEVHARPWLSRDTGFLPGFGAWRPSRVTGIMAAGPALRAPVRPAGSVAPVLLAAQTGRPDQAGWPEWSGTSALDTAELPSYRH